MKKTYSLIARALATGVFLLAISGAARAQDQPLWDRWYYLVVLVGLLGTEWFLRRRFGYI